jgi:hypothetical protein
LYIVLLQISYERCDNVVVVRQHFAIANNSRSDKSLVTSLKI